MRRVLAAATLEAVTVGNIEGGQGKEAVLTVTKLNAFNPSFPKGKPL